MKTRIQHPVYRIQKTKTAVGGTPDGGDRDGQAELGTKVGWSGFKRAECRKGSRICPRKSLITRLTRFNPLQPALIFASEACIQYGERENHVTSEAWIQCGEARGAKLCEKNYGFLRIFSRFSTFLRTDQGRIYAMLRIFTGRSLF